MSSQGIQDHFEAKSANWLAVGIVSLVSNFMNLGQTEPCNEVETFSERWQLCSGPSKNSELSKNWFRNGICHVGTDVRSSNMAQKVLTWSDSQIK